MNRRNDGIHEQSQFCRPTCATRKNILARLTKKVNWKDYMKLWDLRKQQHKGTNHAPNLKNQTKGLPRKL